MQVFGFKQRRMQLLPAVAFGSGIGEPVDNDEKNILTNGRIVEESSHLCSLLVTLLLVFLDLSLNSFTVRPVSMKWVDENARVKHERAQCNLHLLLNKVKTSIDGHESLVLILLQQDRPDELVDIRFVIQ
jgi:hypothetical protein